MMRPEDYNELTRLLNAQSAWAWKRILQRQKEGLEGVIDEVRANCFDDVSLWSDEELKEFFDAHPLDTFDPIGERW